MKTSLLRLVFAALTCALPYIGFCTQETYRPLEPSEISIRADANQPLGEIVATVRVAGSGAQRKITAITLQCGGKSIAVPAKALSGLVDPNLASIRLTLTDGMTDVNLMPKSISVAPAVNIEFHLAYKNAADGQPLQKTAAIRFQDGRAIFRRMSTEFERGMFSEDFLYL